MNRYEKLKVALRYYLIGKGYFRAVDALEFAEEHHTGLRKDGVTPEFQHQIEITHYLRTLLPSLMHPEETLAAALLHDTKEDYNIPELVLIDRFGHQISTAVCLLDKNFKTSEQYFAALAECPVSSIAKGGDRIHNLQSMIGVFSQEKQLRYIAEVKQHFLPMLKAARRNFPHQEAAYENIKHMMVSQVELLEALNA